MKNKYRVTGVVTISTYTIVEATSEEEARQKANDRNQEIEYSTWNDERKNEMFLVDEFDGVVDIREVEEVVNYED